MRTIAVIFDGGFALAVNTDQLVQAVKDGSHLKLKDFPTVEEAYVYACSKHCKREFFNDPYKQPYLPKLEDMLNGQVFYTPSFVSYPLPMQRFFAAVNLYNVAILDNIDDIINFIQQIPNSKIKEVSNLYEAQSYIDFQFLKYILPFGAYIQAPIPRCPQIPLNTIVPVQFAQWHQTNITLKNIPENILDARNGDSNLNLIEAPKNSNYVNELLDLIDSTNQTIVPQNFSCPVEEIENH